VCVCVCVCVCVITIHQDYKSTERQMDIMSVTLAGHATLCSTACPAKNLLTGIFVS